MGESTGSLDGVSGETALGELATLINVDSSNINTSNIFSQFSNDGIYGSNHFSVLFQGQ